MLAVYHPFPSGGFIGDCPICIEPMNKTDLVAHAGDGIKHPLHRACAKVDAIRGINCPTCREPTDTNSLFTWKERVVSELKDVAKDVAKDALFGAGSLLFPLAVDHCMASMGFQAGSSMRNCMSQTSLISLGLLTQQQTISKGLCCFIGGLFGSLVAMKAMGIDAKAMDLLYAPLYAPLYAHMIGSATGSATAGILYRRVVTRMEY